MSPFRGLWSDNSVRAICGIPEDWDLDDFAGPAKVFANVPFPVVPFSGAVTLEEHFTVLAQNGERGLPWNVGNTTLAQDVLKFVGTVPKRIAYGFFGRARFSAPWYENLFEGFQFDGAAQERDHRSVFSQLLNQFRAGGIQTTFFAHVRGEGNFTRAREIIPPLVLAVMDIPPGNDLATGTAREVSGGMASIANGETAATTDVWGAFMTRRNMTDEACAGILGGILATNLDPRSKNVKLGDVRTARSGLSVQGATLVREFKRRGYAALSSRVDQWLRSFLTTDLQGPVAEVIAARLEASLATPIQFGRGDTAVFIETAEFDEDADVLDEDNQSVHDGEAENPDDQ